MRTWALFVTCTARLVLLLRSVFRVDGKKRSKQQSAVVLWFIKHRANFHELACVGASMVPQYGRREPGSTRQCQIDAARCLL